MTNLNNIIAILWITASIIWLADGNWSIGVMYFCGGLMYIIQGIRAEGRKEK